MRDDGFTLIEALVALVILAVATVGLVRAAEAHVDSIGKLEARTAAEWVAVNRLAELSLPNAGSGSAETEMLGQRWRVTDAERTTDDPDLRAVTVTVAPVGGTAVASLDGFIDKGPQP